MIPRRVRARNYGPYAEVDWAIPEGLTALVGVNGVGDGANSNGAGKTKLLELVPICLFGPSLPWGEYLTTGGAETTCMVELEFSHRDDTYRVRRTFDAKGRGRTTLDFERHVFSGANAPSDAPGGWHSLNRSDQRETQALIADTIGLSEATFAHSVFAGQGAQHFAAPDLPPRERKAILTEALDLSLWPTLEKACRADVAEAEHTLAELDTRAGSLQEEITELPALEEKHAELTAVAELASRDLGDCETRETAARERLATLRDAADERERVATHGEAVAARLTALREVASAGAAAADTITKHRDRIAALKPLVDNLEVSRARVLQHREAEKAFETYTRERLRLDKALLDNAREQRRISEEMRSFVIRADEIEETISRLLSGAAATCDHCGQRLADDAARNRSIASHRFDQQALKEAADQRQQSLEAVTTSGADLQAEVDALSAPTVPDSAEKSEALTELKAAEDAVNESALLTGAIQTLAATVERSESVAFLKNLELAEQEAAESERDLAALPAVDPEALSAASREHERAVLDVTAARATDRQTQTELATIAERLRNLAARASQAEALLTERAAVATRLETLTTLAKAYGRDGIPALILEASAIPQVEAETQRVLEELGMPFRVELVTQRENKTGGLKDTLDVVVHTPEGPRRYESYSGGERTRLELALRIGLARLIASRSAAQCGLLALDEPSWLDQTGMAQLAEVLRGLTEFRSVVLVSHDERLVEAFDHAVTVVRDASGSRLVEAA